MKTRYRNKLNKIVVELNYEGKWYYIKTLPTPDKLFPQECLDKVSYLEAEKSKNIVKDPDKVLLININRSPEKDINETLPRELTEEEKRLAWELSK